MAFKQIDLAYDYNALEPHIDGRTMDIHYNKHHAGYTKKLNAAVEGTENADKPIEDVLAKAGQLGTAVRNNGGGFYNHNLYFDIMGPNKGGKPSGDIADAINSAFGSFDSFKEQFSKAALGRFGSGWAWLIVNGSGKLEITDTPNQDNPLMDVATTKGTPVLGIDVWEHAYYLNYQNRRPDYVEAFYNVIDWDKVNSYFKKAQA